MSRPPDLSVVETIMSLCLDHKEGIGQQALMEELSLTHDVKGETFAHCINTLLAQNKVEMLQSANSRDLYIKAVPPETALKFKGLTTEERLVYQHIETSKGKGTWTRDLKRLTNLQQPQIQKILKNLEGRSLVKAVRGPNSHRKLFMLYDTEPDTSVTGGAWFTDNEFDSEFVTVLQSLCARFTDEKGPASLEDIHDFITRMGVTSEPLKEEDIAMIMSTLERDGEVQRVAREGEEDLYRAVRASIPDVNVFNAFPCGICPVQDQCSEEGKISPAKCIYFTQHISF